MTAANARRHGGARPGAGRKRTQVDERRARVLRAAGRSYLRIAQAMGVGEWVIKRVLREAK